MEKIHSTAVISPDAEIGNNVQIGPYTVIEQNVVLGPDCWVGPHAHIYGFTRIGEKNRIFTAAVIGSPPQDLKYKGEKTYLEIGDNNTIREFVTVNPGTSAGDKTIIGNNNLIMAYSHIAHNCEIGSNVIIANAGTLAGHVKIEDFAILGGLTGVHQFCSVGKYSITGGCSKITKDIVPFVMADGHPAVVCGINKVGLRRKNFGPDKIALIEKAYKILFRQGLNVSKAVTELKKIPECEEINSILNFVKTSRRGIAKEK
jgi:UDP-N-acetylglucosamine acyltransferase